MSARFRTVRGKVPPVVFALDLSLTGTGWAVGHDGADGFQFGTFSPPKKIDGMRRISWILSHIFRMVEQNRPVIVAMEGLAFASRDRNHERSGLAFLVRYKLWQMDIPYVLVAPTSLKKFTAGSGKAEKSKMMLQVFKRWGIETNNDNESDAIALWHVGSSIAGISKPETKAQAQVVAKAMTSLVPGKNGSTV